jgi:hypothetical protein
LPRTKSLTDQDWSRLNNQSLKIVLLQKQIQSHDGEITAFQDEFARFATDFGGLGGAVAELSESVLTNFHSESANCCDDSRHHTIPPQSSRNHPFRPVRCTAQFTGHFGLPGNLRRVPEESIFAFRAAAPPWFGCLRFSHRCDSHENTLIVMLDVRRLGVH